MLHVARMVRCCTLLASCCCSQPFHQDIAAAQAQQACQHPGTHRQQRITPGQQSKPGGILQRWAWAQAVSIHLVRMHGSPLCSAAVIQHTRLPRPSHSSLCDPQVAKPQDQRKLHPSPKAPVRGSPAAKGLIKAYTPSRRPGRQAAADTLDLGTSSDEEGQARPGLQRVAMFNAAPGAAPAASRVMQAPQASMLHHGSPKASGYMPAAGSKEVYAKKQAAKQALQQVRAGAAAAREQQHKQHEAQQQPVPPPVAKESSFTRKHIGMAAARQGPPADMPGDESQLLEASWHSYSGSGAVDKEEPYALTEQAAGQQMPGHRAAPPATYTTATHHASPHQQQAAAAPFTQAPGSPASAGQPHKLSHLQMKLAKKRLERATATGLTSPNQPSPAAPAPMLSVRAASYPHHSAPTSPVATTQRSTPGTSALRSSWAAGSRAGQQQAAPLPAPGRLLTAPAGGAPPAASGGLMSPPSTGGGSKTVARLAAAGPSRLAPAASTASAQLDSLIQQLQHDEPTLEELAGMNI
jgi:hypothetical protein